MNRSPHRASFSFLRRCCERAATVVIAVLVPLLLLPGCSSTRYKPASKKTPPPVLLNLPSTEPPIEALLHTVIIYRGPGSWKRDAYWDEYVVTVANRGNALVTIESAWLTDFQDETTEAGTDPWKLETTSRTLVAKGFGFPRHLSIEIGGGLTALALGGGVGALVFSGGFITAGAGAIVGGILILPAIIGTTIYTNIDNRHAIEREFERRRLVLPSVLVPGQLVQGTLFFRISPGPQMLTLKCRIDNEPREVVIDLSPLAGLHLKAKPAPAPAPTATPRG